MNKKCTGVEQIRAQEENRASGEWNFLYIWQNVYRENTVESEGKSQNTECIFQVPVPRVVKILIIYFIMLVIGVRPMAGLRQSYYF